MAMEIGLRQSYVLGFENRFPLMAKFLQNRLETAYAGLFEEVKSRPDKYKFGLSVEYYGEDEEDIVGEPVTAADGRKLCEARTVLICGHYPGKFGSTQTALIALNIMNPKAGFSPEEVRVLEVLFDQIKSYPLDSIPREIEV